MSIFKGNLKKIAAWVEDALNGMKPFYGALLHDRDGDYGDRRSAYHAGYNRRDDRRNRPGTHALIMEHDFYGLPNDIDWIQLEGNNSFGIGGDMSLYYSDYSNRAIYCFDNDDLVFALLNEMNRLLVEELHGYYKKEGRVIPTVQKDGSLKQTLWLSAKCYPSEYSQTDIQHYDSENFLNTMVNILPLVPHDYEELNDSDGLVCALYDKEEDRNFVYDTLNAPIDGNKDIEVLVLRVNDPTVGVKIVGIVATRMVKRTCYLIIAKLHPKYDNDDLRVRLLKASLTRVAKASHNHKTAYCAVDTNADCDVYSQMGFKQPKSITTEPRIREHCGDKKHVLQYSLRTLVN